jgi:hypothetical protein
MAVDMHHSQTDFDKAITKAITKVGFLETLAMLEKIYEPKRQMAEIVNGSDLFPCIVVVGRKNAAKVRKAKKSSTKDQNNYGIATFYARDMGELTVMRNNLKHKGYPILLVYVDASPWEIPHEDAYRYARRAYKSFDEYMSIKGMVNNKDWIKVANEIQKESPAKAHGQMKLISSEIVINNKAPKPFPKFGSKKEPVQINNQTSLF